MANYIFDKFDRVRDWIEDNRLVKYQFRSKPASPDSRENNFIFVYNPDASQQENLRMLEKRLSEHGGQRLYGTGFRSDKTTVGGMECIVQYPDRTEQDSDMMARLHGMIGQPAFDREELERSITEKIEMKYKLARLEDERKDFERERKEFQEEKNNAIGALIQYFAPVAQAILERKGLAKVAGTDVPAERIVPVDDEPEQTPDPDDLPEEEASQAYELLKRFRKVEPNYLQLLESVVTMAENGDTMYATAKTFLIK